MTEEEKLKAVEFALLHWALQVKRSVIEVIELDADNGYTVRVEVSDYYVAVHKYLGNYDDIGTWQAAFHKDRADRVWEWKAKTKFWEQIK